MDREREGRGELPQGVPASNAHLYRAPAADRDGARTRLAADASTAAYAAPDMATPRFASAAEPRPAAKPDPTAGLKAGPQPSAASAYSTDLSGARAAPAGRRGSAGKTGGSFIGARAVLWGLVGAALAAGLAVLMVGTTDRAPLCADQPAWNQYNCRAL